MNRKLISTLLLTTMLAACGGGGGGGGGIVPFPDQPPNPPPSDPQPPRDPNFDLGLEWFTPKSVTTDPAQFRTSEFNAARGLSTTGAEFAYGAGAFGAGVKVGVLDSYVRSGPALDAEFGSRLNITNWRADDLGSGFQHGAHVIGIIGAARDGTGMHGIAPEAEIFAHGVIPSSTGSVSFQDIFDAYSDMANAGVRVVNNSWGSSLDRVPSDGEPMVLAARAGMTMVFATGNNSAANPLAEARMPEFVPDIEDHWIAVTSYDIDTKQLSSFANACGTAKNWCIAAPGENVLSTQSGNYVFGSGTSMATPFVTGAFALLASAYPELDNVKVRQLIFATADDLGAPGVDAVFGHGALNIERAFKPFGSLTVANATGELVPGALERTMVVAPSALGDGFVAALSNATIATKDEFGRIYDIGANQFAMVERGSALRSARNMAGLGWREAVSIDRHREGFMSMGFGNGASADPWRTVSPAFSSHPLVDPSAVATGIVTGGRAGDVNWFATGYATAPNGNDDQTQVISALGLRGKEGILDWMVAGGVSAEFGGLMGQKGSGVLETRGDTFAGFVSAGAGIEVSDRLRLGLEGHAVQLGYRGDGAVSKIDAFATSWNLTARVSRILSDHDSVTLSVGQPLAVRSGEVSLNSVGRVPGTGIIGSSTVKSAFSSGSDTLALGLAWSTPVAIAEGGRLSLGISHTTGGGTTSDTGIFGRLEFRF